MEFCAEAKFAVQRASRDSFQMITYTDRRQMIEDQLQRLFVDTIWHSGGSPGEDRRALDHLCEELEGFIRTLPNRVTEDWERSDAAEDATPPAPAANERSSP